MLKLQDTNVFYDDTDLGSIQDLNYIGEGFSIPLPGNAVLFIPEQDATPEEQAVFQAYHEYYKETGGVKPPEPVPDPGPIPPTPEERITQLEAENTDLKTRLELAEGALDDILMNRLAQ